MRVLRSACAAAMCASLLGCASSKTAETLQNLQESVDAYNEAYRWKNYERAASYLPSDLRQAFLATYEDADNSLHVEDFQILNVKLESEEAATVTVRVRYMQLPSINVDRKTVVQHWHRVGGAWILEVEENSIRELDKGATPRNPEARDGRGAPAEQEGKTGVKVTSPGGEVIRSEGDVADEPEPPR
jgi:hypothetical protein